MNTEPTVTPNSALNQLLEAFAALLADKLSEQIAAAPQPRYYSPDDLAQRYGVTPDAIRKRIRAGEFGETINFGNRCRRVTQAGVDAFEAAHAGAAYTASPVNRPRSPRKRPDPGRI